MTMSSLPKACQAVLDAPDPESIASVTLDIGESIASAPAISASAYSETPDRSIPTPFPRPAN